MNYFKKRENVDLYTKMMEEYDNAFVISKIKDILPKHSTILEIGMGTGNDLIELSEEYDVLGSDNSKYFVEDFKKKYNIEAIMLDAISIDINKKFDCIYSNKVLQHLSKEEFIQSLVNQGKHIHDNGMIFMTLWKGEYKETFEFDNQLRFVYYNEGTLRKIVPAGLVIHDIIYYREFDDNDSIILILKKD